MLLTKYHRKFSYFKRFLQVILIKCKELKISKRIILLKLIYNQQLMTEQQFAFDNWEQEAEQELHKQPVQQATKQETKEQIKPEMTVQQAKQEKIKQDAIDSQKLFLLKLASYKQINQDKFDDYLQAARETSTNPQVIGSNQILKNDKDFAQYAKKVAKRLNDKTAEDELENIQDNNILAFFEEAVLLIYNQLEWKNIQHTKEKLFIVKKEKKDEEIKIKKQKQKDERMKKQGKILKQGEEQSPKKQTKEEDDIFGGATLVNSKQIEDQLKKKPAQKLQAPAKKVEQEDDDFM